MKQRNLRAAGKSDEKSQPRATRPVLTREGIVKTALRIVDQEGYESLSMRRLGAELEVDPMAVYYHIPNKSALWDGIVEAVMSEIDLAIDDPSKKVEERLFVAMQEYRRVLLSHPQALQVITSRSVNTQAAFRPVEVVLSILMEGGFSVTDAIAAVDILAAFVRGAVTIQVNNSSETELNRFQPGAAEALLSMLPPDEFPIMNQVMMKGCFMGFDAEFNRGVKALVHGLMDIYANDGRE